MPKLSKLALGSMPVSFWAAIARKAALRQELRSNARSSRLARRRTESSESVRGAASKRTWLQALPTGLGFGV